MSPAAAVPLLKVPPMFKLLLLADTAPCALAVSVLLLLSTLLPVLTALPIDKRKADFPVAGVEVAVTAPSTACSLSRA